jgi:hypothetical protein
VLAALQAVAYALAEATGNSLISCGFHTVRLAYLDLEEKTSPTELA